MTRAVARTAFAALNARPALVSANHAGRADVTGTNFHSGLVGDLTELSQASVADSAAAWTARKHDLCAAYGRSAEYGEKPFAYSQGMAVIPIHGTLINRYRYSSSYATGYAFIREQVAAAMADPDVVSIVYDVNSSGGMVAGCMETGDLIYAASKRGGGSKQSLAVVDTNCFSAAYWLASAADRIVVTPSGEAGSIGVLLAHLDVSAMLEAMGVKVTFIHAGKHKVDGNMYEPLSDEVKGQLQAEIDSLMEVFVGAVAKHRQMEPDAVRATEARCYFAAEAVSIGLVDAVQTPSVALKTFLQESVTLEDDDMSGSAEKKTEAAADTGPTADQAKSDERARIKAITGHAEATGREALAAHLAFDTTMSAEDAAGVLAKAPKPAPAQAPAEQKQQSHFKNAMDASKSPNVGANTEGGEEEPEPTGSKRLLAAHAAATGYRPEK